MIRLQLTEEEAVALRASLKHLKTNKHFKPSVMSESATNKIDEAIKSHQNYQPIVEWEG